MSWPRALRWYAVAALLVGYYCLFELPGNRKLAGDQATAEVLVKAAPQDVTEIYVENERGRARFRRAGGRWRAVGKPSHQVPPDLVEALVETLTSGQSAEVVSEEGSKLEVFGLDRPRARIELKLAGRRETVTVLLGNQIPTGTAVYGKLVGSSKIFKVGANVDYYQGQLLIRPAGSSGPG